MYEDELVNLLIKKKMHISFAESCTGGLAAATIINVANASKVIDMSVITYANDAKVKLVGVNEQTITNFGVVSEEVALEMARGVANLAKCEIGVGISGIAGPSGGTDKKPVGMVCFGIYYLNKEYSFTKLFGEIGRNLVRTKSVDFILNKLIEILKGE